MKIITRYVLSELLQVFLVALSALTLFMLVIGLVKEAQQQGLGLMQILALIPYVLPEAMRFAVPGTMLFAVASVFGRMSASNEITALKAAGITPMAVIWPATACGGWSSAASKTSSTAVCGSSVRTARRSSRST